MQILGPSKNVNRWRCPDSSLARAAAGSSPLSHRSGLNILASGPQMSSERWMARIGIVMIVPRAMEIQSVVAPPAAASAGMLRGTTSSSIAYRMGGQSDMKSARAIYAMMRTTRLISPTGA